MKRPRLLLGGLLACLMIVLVWERLQIAQLRRSKAALGQAREQSAELSANPKELKRLRELVQSWTAPAYDKTELLRLRNEVGQLRARVPEWERLSAANERLAAELEAGTHAPLRLADLEGFQAKEKWVNAGLSSPEATVQTFFWAARDRAVDHWLSTLLPDQSEQLRRELEKKADAANDLFRKELTPLTAGSGFRIASQETAPDGTVKIGVQVAAGGEVMVMQLRLVEGQWRIADIKAD